MQQEAQQKAYFESFEKLSGIKVRAFPGADPTKVKVMVVGYNQWLDHNNTTSGSYIDKDIEMEMNSCQLASRLVAQMQAD